MEHVAEAQDTTIGKSLPGLGYACCGPLVLDANLPFLSFDFVFSLPLSPVSVHYGIMLPFRCRISLHFYLTHLKAVCNQVTCVQLVINLPATQV